MNKLIKLNIIIWLIFFIIPHVSKIETTTVLFEDTISLIIEKEEEPIASRSDAQRVDTLHISEDGLSLLKKCEGIDKKAIKYTGEQYYTIGHGHYGSDVKANQTITLEEADELLRNDMMNEYEDLVRTNFDYLELTQNEFDALCIFAYNVSPKSVKQITANKTRTKEQLMESITSYTKSGSESNRRGLLKRRNIEKRVFLEGDYTYEKN